MTFFQEDAYLWNKVPEVYVTLGDEGKLYLSLYLDVSICMPKNIHIQTI